MEPMQNSSTQDHSFPSPILAGVLLFVATAIALVVANSPFYNSWTNFWHIELGLEVGPWRIHQSFLHWINDGLMALFFFTVGLELKREFIAGSLSHVQDALLPVMAAIGGMVVPATLYMAFNSGGIGANGWGIPMATDIAFAVGILALLGNRVPTSVKVFVTALAIADDLGAVLVIALFYTSEISLNYLFLGLFFLLILVGANLLGVRKPWFYGLVGILGIWTTFLFSGIHATVAGVLIAFTIPARTRIDERAFTDRLRRLTEEFVLIPPNDVTLLEPKQAEVLGRIGRLTRSADTPLQRLEHAMAPFVGLLIMPVFALANAGIRLTDLSLDQWFGPVSFGVFLGLLVGKWLGIVGVSSLLLALKWVKLPEGMSRRDLLGAGLLCGVGFTMALFVANLAFGESSSLEQAKVGILVSSILAGTAAFLWFRWAPRAQESKPGSSPE